MSSVKIFAMQDRQTARQTQLIIYPDDTYID